MTIEEFSTKHIEGYLFCDLEKMADIKPSPGEQYGGVGYPMVASILSGMELLGGLLSLNAFDRDRGNTYSANYWDDYLSISCPRYAIPGLKELFRNLVRHGIAHTFLAKIGVWVTKNDAPNHLQYGNQGQNALVIDTVELFSDLKKSYLDLVKPIVFQNASRTRATKSTMQDRLNEMLTQYSNDSNRFFNCLPPQQSQISGLAGATGVV